MLRKLLIRPGGIGDCILSIPAMECLRSTFTEVWVPSSVVPLIRFADAARAISGTGLDLLGLPGVSSDSNLIEYLRSFDSIVSWYGANRPDFRQAMAALGLPFEFLQALPDVHSRVHCCDFFLGQVGCPMGARPRIDCGSIRRADLGVIHPFSGDRKKNWPLDRFRELAARLPMPARWCAGPEEDPPEENFNDAIRIDNLYELGCWLASARVYIGNDSGITHLAAAVGASVVAIFGPSDPAVWAPRGERARVVHGHLGQITVDEVMNAVCALL